MENSWLPKITIVTPSYNQTAYLEQTLKSVLNQGYPNLEYIVMDGGSTDGSVAIIKRYADRLTHWESHPDNGQADAIYRGFERGTGDILGYLNSDDIYLPGCLEKVGRYFRKHPEDEWVVGGGTIVGPNGELLRDRFGLPRCSLSARATFHQLLFFGCPFGQPSSFWRRDVFFEVGGFDRTLRFCFDGDLFLRLARRRPSGRIRKFLAAFRVHAASKSSTICHVQNAENELIWKKHGRYKKNTLYQKMVYWWYTQNTRVRPRLVSLGVLLGLLRLPAWDKSNENESIEAFRDKGNKQ